MCVSQVKRKLPFGYSETIGRVLRYDVTSTLSVTYVGTSCLVRQPIRLSAYGSLIGFLETATRKPSLWLRAVRLTIRVRLPCAEPGVG